MSQLSPTPAVSQDVESLPLCPKYVLWLRSRNLTHEELERKDDKTAMIPRLGGNGELVPWPREYGAWLGERWKEWVETLPNKDPLPLDEQMGPTFDAWLLNPNQQWGHGDVKPAP